MRLVAGVALLVISASTSQLFLACVALLSAVKLLTSSEPFSIRLLE